MKTYIDLHMHSTASDGTLTPGQLIESALAFREHEDDKIVMALTDHDTVAGVKEYMDAAAAHTDVLTAIPGVEISTDYNGVEIHILGYDIDINNQELLDQLKIYRASRDGRNEKIIEKLNEKGFDISLADIQSANPDDTIARPHIAKALLKKGYVASVQEAFDLYLAEGRCCFVDRIMPSPEDSIRLIKNSGGFAVLAHIMLYKKLDEEAKGKLVAYLKELGLVGIEAYYNTYSEEQMAYVKDLARANDLILTGGTDYHGANKPHISLFIGQGEMEVPEEILGDYMAQF